MAQGQLADAAAGVQARGAGSLVLVKFGQAARAVEAFFGGWLLENSFEDRVLRLLQLEVQLKCFGADSSFNVIVCSVILAALERTFQLFTFSNNVYQILKIFGKTALTKAMSLTALFKHIQQLQPLEHTLAHRAAELLAKLRRLQLLQHQRRRRFTRHRVHFFNSSWHITPFVIWRFVCLASKL
jgi:hypothetical protein